MFCIYIFDLHASSIECVIRYLSACLAWCDCGYRMWAFFSLSLSLRLQNPFGDVLIKTIAHAFHFVTLCSSVQAEQTNKLFIRHLIEIAALVSVLHSIITATFINIYGNFTHATHTNIDFSKFFGWVFHEWITTLFVIWLYSISSGRTEKIHEN